MPGLFNTYKELQEFGPVTADMNMVTFGSFIRRANRTFLYPAISKDFYDYIRTTAQVPSSLSPAEAEALQLMKEAEAVLAFYCWVTFGQVNFSQAGIRIANTDGWKTAFQWQVQDIKRECLHSGLAAVEELVELLSENLALYPIYEASEEYDRNYSGFINGGKEFNEYFSLIYPRYTFIVTGAIRRRVERESVIPILGQLLADEIIFELKEQQLSSANRRIIDFIRGAVANLTIAKAMVELSVEIGDRGVTVFSDSGNTGTITKLQPASDTRLVELRKSCQATGESYLNQLRNYLQARPSDYPLYTKIEASPTFKNDLDGSTYALFT